MNSIDFEIEEKFLENLYKKESINLNKNSITREDTYKLDIYPLFKNYNNGSEEYYLKLKSIDFKAWKNKVNILFYENLKKYKNYLEKLNFNTTNENYNLIISDSLDALKLKSSCPIILINCELNYFIDSQREILFFYDNKKLYKKAKKSLTFNEFDVMCGNYTQIIDAIAKIHKGE